MNWENYIINERLSYSSRDTVYEENNYPSNLHYHDYYEVVVFEKGDIHYVCDTRVYYPKYGDVIVIPPGMFHMSVIDSDKTHYKRHVFYLYTSAFDVIGYNELTTFLNRVKNGGILSIDSMQLVQELMSVLGRLEKTFREKLTSIEKALGLSYLIQVFYLLNKKECQPKSEIEFLPQHILKVQEYINKNFSQISSISQIAEHFFYSREHVSRLFKKYFDISISDYITKRRIAESQVLIKQGLPIIDVAFQVGFGSLPTFIRAFRSILNMTPSEYRNLQREANQD